MAELTKELNEILGIKTKLSIVFYSQMNGQMERTKQTLVATSSNHAEIIAMHEASRECVWLRSMTQHIQKMCEFHLEKRIPTILYEDNAACIAKLK